MKRSRQRLFDGVAALSLLLFTAAVSLWVRSYWAGDRFFRSSFENENAWTYWTQDDVRIGWGAFGFNRIVQSSLRDGFEAIAEDMLAKSPNPHAFHNTWTATYPDFHFRDYDPATLGFKIGRFAHGRSGRRPESYGYEIIVPFWFLAIVFAGLPGLWLFKWSRRRKRSRIGLCSKCGYDLRATPERCPECGAVPAGKEIVSG
jgi:hypothetical protein